MLNVQMFSLRRWHKCSLLAIRTDHSFLDTLTHDITLPEDISRLIQVWAEFETYPFSVKKFESYKLISRSVPRKMISGEGGGEFS